MINQQKNLPFWGGVLCFGLMLTEQTSQTPPQGTGGTTTGGQCNAWLSLIVHIQGLSIPYRYILEIWKAA